MKGFWLIFFASNNNIVSSTETSSKMRRRFVKNRWRLFNQKLNKKNSFVYLRCWFVLTHDLLVMNRCMNRQFYQRTIWINGFTGHWSSFKHLRYTKLFFFWIPVLIRTIWGMFHKNRSKFTFWHHVQILNDLWHKAKIWYNSKTKQRRSIRLYIFGILMTRKTIWHYFQRNWNMFQFLTHVELSRSMAVILEMPQHVA